MLCVFSFITRTNEVRLFIFYSQKTKDEHDNNDFPSLCKEGKHVHCNLCFLFTYLTISIDYLYSRFFAKMTQVNLSISMVGKVNHTRL